MADLLERVLPFVSQWGVYVAGIVAAVSYLSEVYSSLRRDGPATAWSNTKMIVRLAVTTVAVGAALFIVSAQYEKKTPVARAADNIIASYHDCLVAADTMSADDKARIEASPRPIALQCLARAVKRDAPDHASMEPSIALAEDIELGHRLLDDGGDKGVADTLHVYLGINRDTFLGTGYSVPRADSEETDQYSGALVREYLVPNYCAQTMAPRCTSRQDGVWAWSIDPHKLNQLSVRDVLQRVHPNDGADNFEQQWDAHGNADSAMPWLIRFAVFPSVRYKGTVGRPNAAYVFFSELDQTQKLSLREALRRSGATTQEMDNQDPGRDVYVWVMAPADNGDYTKLATWHNVIGLLKSIDIDRRLAQAVAAKPDPLMRRLQ